MRWVLGLGWAAVATTLGLAVVMTVGGAVPEATADRVLGQPGFTSTDCNNGGRSLATLCGPRGIAVSPTNGRVYIADTGNHRVLWYDNPLLGDWIADGVIGQPDASTAGCNTGGVSASSLCEPTSVDLDGSGNLYVADRANSRVLQYNAGGVDGLADRVFGQPDFTSTTCNNGGLSASSLCLPEGVSGDDYFGNVYIADTGNSRVVGHWLPLTVDLVADEIFGQPDFTTAGCNTGGLSATSLCGPRTLNFHGTQHLFVADAGNDRVVLYDNPLANSIADVVLGQPDFVSSGCNNGGIGDDTVCGARGVAIDEDMNTYVADTLNRRVLQYDDPLLTDSIAETVYGQGDFVSSACYAGGVSASSLCTPAAVAVDYNGNLFVLEEDGNRALGFDRCAGDIDCDAVLNGSDNCPTAANAGQENSDRNFIDTTPPLTQDDGSRPESDAAGDACDTDDDNDGLTDAVEAGLPGVACPAATAALNPLHPDSDGDGAMDSAECAIGTNPNLRTSKPTADQCRILAGAPTITTDSDGDLLPERIEACGYGTSTTSIESDGDTWTDGCEVASLNMLPPVNSLDQLALAQGIIAALGGTYVWNADLNKDGVVGSGDQLLMAQIRLVGGCPMAPPVTPTPTFTVTPTATLTSSCFGGETLISMADGSTRRIDSLAVGDVVLAWDLAAGQAVEGQVADVYARTSARHLVVGLANGEELRVTPEHPFFDPATGEYREIRTFEVGEAVAMAGDGGALVETAIASVRWVQEPLTVYNLHVDAPSHNYFANGVLVHNKTPTQTWTPTPTSTPAQ